MRLRALLATAVAAALLAPASAQAHPEREVEFPSGAGEVPTYRTDGPYLLVCKNRTTLSRIRELPPKLRAENLALFRECRQGGFRHVQEAVDAVRRPGTRILILPGIYQERPSLRPQPPECQALPNEQPLTYEQQQQCPHHQNLVAIFGDGPDEDIACDGPRCNLQLEGTGRHPKDVVIDGRFEADVVLRADRADGVYFRNFTVQRAREHAVYVIETDGFAIDRMRARWNGLYGFLNFMTDHGLYHRCEAYGNGDGGVYPGSQQDLNGERPSLEIRYCRSHHNMLGYSGTSANSTYVHHNRFYQNMVGVAMDSFVPDHPGAPQDSSTFLENRIYANNQDYYRYLRDGTCDRPWRQRGIERGVVCPTFPVPIGTGIFIAGGNANTVERNHIWNNWRAGTMLMWIPAALREEYAPANQYDTSHHNRQVDNRMGFSPKGKVRPNGVDFWWDLEGEGNCWQGNQAAPGHEITSDPPVLPGCDFPEVMSPASRNARFATCATWSRDNVDPPGCPWTERPPRPD